MRHRAVIIRAGLFSGGGACAWTLFEYAMGWHNEQLEIAALTGFVAIVFPIVAIVWTLRAIGRAQGGLLTMTQALASGLGISAISALIGVVFFALYYTMINPAFLAEMAARGQRVNVPVQIVAVAAGSLLVGLIISAVAGYTLRTQEVTER